MSVADHRLPEPSTTHFHLLQAGDTAGWQRLDHFYRPVVECWCVRLGVPERDVADVTQDVFLTLS